MTVGVPPASCLPACADEVPRGVLLEGHEPGRALEQAKAAEGRERQAAGRRGGAVLRRSDALFMIITEEQTDRMV
eukprot:COSAG01_NODE_42719_length_437_cov_0.905325_1_plen_74_part_01